MNLDLVALAADKSIEETLRGLLERPQAVGIRPTRYEVIRHPEKDPGCFHNPEEYLHPYVHDSRHALVVLDQRWEGVPNESAEDLAVRVEERLRDVWNDRAGVVVIDPELEVWVWSDSPHVDDVLGWRGRTPSLRDWLQEHGLWDQDQPKPPDPKAAYEAALQEVQLQKSSSNFRSLAERVGLGRCADRSFRRLLEILRDWFPRT